MKGFHLKRTAGFSLLELMVVVAIIGVLAAVAVPRFNIFRARARQAEAKSNLGVIFTLQEAFKIDKEKYYDGNHTTWGGERMDAYQPGRSVGYNTTTAAGVATGSCGTNKLGFRLANCNAARYRYWITAANEFYFIASAWAPSDSTASRIFPGCKGTQSGFKKPSDSKSPKKCSSAVIGGTRTPYNTDILTGATRGGDAFCLDQDRTIDNFRDIVEDPQCKN